MTRRTITICNYDMFTTCMSDESRGAYAGAFAEARIEVVPDPEPTPVQEMRILGKYAKKDEPHASLWPQEEGSWQGIINRPLKLSARRAVWRCDHRHRAETEALACAQRQLESGR